MRRILHFLKEHAFGVTVVLIWLYIFSQLVQRHILPTHTDPGPPLSLKDTPIGPGEEEWMGVYYQGGKIGYSRSTLRPQGEGYRLQEQSFLKITAQGFPLTVSMKLDALTRFDFTMESFSFNLQTGLVNTHISGKVEGNLLKLDLETAGKRSSQTLTIDVDPTLPGSLSGILRNRALAPGQVFSFPSFDPVTMSFRETTVRVEGKEPLDVGGKSIPCFFLSTDNAGIRMDLWVDEAGRIWKQATPSGWVMLRESREEALTAGWPAGAGIDMISATSVQAEGRKISTPSKARFMSILLPLDSTGSLNLHGGRQVHRPGKFQPVKITREEVTETEAPDLPITDPEFEPYLASSLLVQADHPEIRRQAQAIAGDETNSLRAARRILEWIHENVDRRAVPSLPNALEVLHHRSGDCNECTVLYVALARALGLPARTNAGLVYLDGKFYYHAWPEVFAGHWVTLDPVFGQLPADATHLRLTTGGIEKQVEIARLIGQLKTIHVLDVKYD